MAKKKNKKEKLSFEEECLMWSSYRYCIGRKTYVSSMAYYTAQKYYNLLSEQRMLFAAQDIRNEMENHFNWMCFEFKYEGNVSKKSRKPYEDCVEFIMNEIVKEGDTSNEIEEKLLKIASISVYHETYADDAPHKYHITYRDDADVRNYIWQNDISSYQCWAELAAVFDKEHYKKVHVNVNGKEEDVICFESWVEDSVPIPDQPGFYRHWPWHWKKVYIGVNDFIEKGEQAGYIVDEYVTSVEDYDAREEKSN